MTLSTSHPVILLKVEASSPRRSLPGKPHPYLRRGEGLARFHIQHREQRSPKRKLKASRSQCSKTPPTNPAKQGRLPQVVCPGVPSVDGEGEEARVHSHQPEMCGSTGAMPQSVARGSTPLLGSRFSSDESFIIRGTRRVKVSSRGYT